MIILNITMEPSSNIRWKQKLEHWTELPKSSWRVEEMRIWAKRSRPWWVHPLKQFIWTNGSSPTPAGQGRKQHMSKLFLLNVGDSCMTGENCGTTDSGTRTTDYTDDFATYSLWMNAFLSLDIVKRALEVPQSNVPSYPLWGVDVGRSGRVRWRE